ncbi:AGE family epimerase/isomerase, partial [Salmonella enterica subsp. enterica serovar Anatum]|nr:AGE family epimerase/isomerase [Salmonella enterica subsp. enterica serovar Anatum]
ASAVTTGHPEARKLLDYTIEVIEKYFWSEEEQMCLESWDEAFMVTSSLFNLTLAETRAVTWRYTMAQSGIRILNNAICGPARATG